MLADSSTVGVSWAEGRECHLMKAEGPEVEAFCDAVFAGGMDAAEYGIEGAPEAAFAMGLAAGIDALASGRIDFADPLGTLEAAWADVSDTAESEPCRATDVARRYWGAP